MTIIMDSSDVCVRGKAKDAFVEKKKSKSKRAGLKFPISRVAKYMKKGRYANKIGSKASVYLTAVLEYLVAELLESSGYVTKSLGKKRISPQHMQMAISKDDEICEILTGTQIANTGRTISFPLPSSESKDDTANTKPDKISSVCKYLIN